METKEQVKHTAIPWEARKGYFPYVDALIGERFGPVSVARVDMLGLERGTQEANAAFIVRTVNCHEELLEACIDAVLRLIHFGSPADRPIVDKLKAVIAKAEGR